MVCHPSSCHCTGAPAPNGANLGPTSHVIVGENILTTSVCVTCVVFPCCAWCVLLPCFSFCFYNTQASARFPIRGKNSRPPSKSFARRSILWEGPRHHASKYLLTNSRGQRGSVRATKLISAHVFNGVSCTNVKIVGRPTILVRPPKRNLPIYLRRTDYYPCRSRR